MTSARLQPTETLIHIARYLAPAELAAACQVCRRWFIPFAGELWRSIQPDQWTHGALTAALPRYSVFIQQLRCSRFVALDQLGPECRHLNLFITPDITLANVDVIKAILERNPGLEDLELLFELSRSDIAKMDEVLEIVSGMSGLKKLLLDSLMATPEWIEQQVLGRMPRLESLYLCLYSNTTLITDPSRRSLEQHEHGQQPQQMPTKGLPLVMSPLRSLYIEGSTDTLNILRRITRLSPELELLSLSETRHSDESFIMSPELAQLARDLPLHCPRLDELHLVHNCMDEAGLACLLRCGFPNLRIFFGGMPIEPPTPIVLNILVHTPTYQFTLEEVVITKPPWLDERPPSNSTVILQMLRTFPRLRKVSLDRCAIDAEEMVYGAGYGYGGDNGGIQGDAVAVAATGSEGSSSNDNTNIQYPPNWVCHDLEVLELTIKGPRARWVPPGYITRDKYKVTDDERDYNDDDENDNDENGDGGEAATGCDERSNNHRRSHDVFYRVKAQLDLLPKLDVRGITYSHRHR